MGYTHYWAFNKPKRGTTKQANKAYLQALRDATTVANAYSTEYGGLSGFSAHTKPGEYGGFHVNGSANSGTCEDFQLREHYRDNVANFCKTDRKPYDIVVVATLCILKHHLGELFSVSSDGETCDWQAGLVLARTVIPGCRMPDTIRRTKLYSVK